MLDMGVWRHVKRNDHPNDHRLVGCRWVFKVKRNGVYHARLVAKGFSQIPCVDFTDSYSPVVNDVTFRVVEAIMQIENLKGKVRDIDNAFLNGDLEHEIYMKIPEGYDEVINPRIERRLFNFAQGNIWIGSSSKTILKENCGQDPRRRFQAE